MNHLLAPSRLITSSVSAYQAKFARHPAEVRAAQALRFAVFNLEIHEGLDESYLTGLDADPYDQVCDHLLVEHLPTNTIVGTYRLQTGLTAGENLGYYCEQEFDFRPYEPVRHQLIELGRACVHQQHRNLVVLGLLWKGIAEYAQERDGRYLCGCSSLTSQDPTIGASAYTDLCRKNLVEVPWRTHPLHAFECPIDQFADETPPLPKLLRAYLSLGAKICGPPALDRQFKTIDFLTFLDLREIPSAARTRFFS